MCLIVIALALSASAVGDGQAKQLLDTINPLQGPLQDFRCEFEGTVRAASQTATGSNAAVNERHDQFGGTFLWKKHGGFWCDSYHEDAQHPRKIERWTMFVRTGDNHAEEHRRLDDAVEGQRTFGSPSVFRTRAEFEGPHGLLLFEVLKDQATNKAHTALVRDDQVDGRALKVLEIRFKDINQLLNRYWIDLGRSGHVVRFEAYWRGEQLRLRREIKLASFRVAGAEIWMPVSGEQVTYSPPTASETGKSEPESSTTISILKETMAFNVGLDATNFAIGYKTGKPTSASSLRRSARFDQQTLAAGKINAAVQQAREAQLDQEPSDGSEPRAVGQLESQPGLRYVAYGFVVTAVIVSIAVRVRRRGRRPVS